MPWLLYYSASAFLHLESIKVSLSNNFCEEEDEACCSLNQLCLHRFERKGGESLVQEISIVKILICLTTWQNNTRRGGTAWLIRSFIVYNFVDCCCFPTGHTNAFMVTALPTLLPVHLSESNHWKTAALCWTFHMNKLCPSHLHSSFGRACSYFSLTWETPISGWSQCTWSLDRPLLRRRPKQDVQRTLWMSRIFWMIP